MLHISLVNIIRDIHETTHRRRFNCEKQNITIWTLMLVTFAKTQNVFNGQQHKLETQTFVRNFFS